MPYQSAYAFYSLAAAQALVFIGYNRQIYGLLINQHSTISTITRSSREGIVCTATAFPSSTKAPSLTSSLVVSVTFYVTIRNVAIIYIRAYAVLAVFIYLSFTIASYIFILVATISLKGIVRLSIPVLNLSILLLFVLRQPIALVVSIQGSERLIRNQVIIYKIADLLAFIYQDVTFVKGASTERSTLLKQLQIVRELLLSHLYILDVVPRLLSNYYSSLRLFFDYIIDLEIELNIAILRSIATVRKEPARLDIELGYLTYGKHNRCQILLSLIFNKDISDYNRIEPILYEERLDRNIGGVLS